MKVYFMGVDEYLPLAESLADYLSVELGIIDEGEAKTFKFEEDDIIYPNYFVKGELIKLFDKAIVVAPHTRISKKWDNKIYQYDNLDVPKPQYTTHNNIFNLVTYLIKNKGNKFVVTSQYGNEGSASILFDLDHLPVYNKYKDMKEERFRASSYFDRSIGVAVNMVLFEDDIFVAPITQQKLDGLKYTGGFYPSNINYEARRRIWKYSLKIGEDLIGDGYLGLCGIDFIVKNNLVLFAEINPRKTGTAVAVSKMLNPSLSVLEYLAVTGQCKPEIVVNKFEWEI